MSFKFNRNKEEKCRKKNKDNQENLLNKFNKKKCAISVAIILTVLLSCFLFVATNKIKKNKDIDPELARAMTYEQFEDGADNVDGTDNVKFSAAFLRDINDDGYAEKIMGTCKNVKERDNLYIELNVINEGYLKNGKIEIAGENFNLITALPKDEQIKEDYYGATKEIELNDVRNGVQKLVTGEISSTILNEPNNYSRNDNKIILTGTYVTDDGTETQIRKEITLTVDWYGEAVANINNTTQRNDIDDLEKEIKDTSNDFKINFKITTSETKQQLILSEQNTKAIIPQLNGYDPINVELKNTVSSYSYNSDTKTLEIVDKKTNYSDGSIKPVSNNNEYNVVITYPIEAYEAISANTIDLNITTETYYKAYNNPNEEFNNPYSSNTAKATVWICYRKFPKDGQWARFDTVFTESISRRKSLNIYDGISAEENDDTYKVGWRIIVGNEGKSNGAVIKETTDGNPQVSDQFIKSDSSFESMENFTTNIGINIYSDNFLDQYDGWVKIYDDDTNELIEEYNVRQVDTYNKGYYMFDKPVKHIRVETSENKANSYLFVSCLKKLDTEYITTHYTKEQFMEFKQVRTEACAYLGEEYVNKDTAISTLLSDTSYAEISVSESTIRATDADINEKITINASENDGKYKSGWVDGSFLVKLPSCISVSKINSVTIDNTSVNISNYELIEKDGESFIKINTKNNDSEQQGYNITIDVNLLTNTGNKSDDIELYASNNVKCSYGRAEEDKYDVNDNLDVKEKVEYSSVGIEIVAPEGVFTNQIISNYDEKGSSVSSPKIVEMSPLYANVDNKDRQAKIGIQIINNYENTVSEVEVLGKIPFKGNSYAISAGDMGSTYTTKMVNTGIEIPEELKESVTVYYSENENVDKNLENEANGWKTAEEVSNWDNIKTYLIDFGEYQIPKSEKIVFYYTIQLPKGLKYNDVSYSHHGVYFCLDTSEGKYRTQIESGKTGIMMAEKFNLELTKYQMDRDKVVSGATYSIKEVVNGQVSEEAKTAVTNEQGKLQIDGLYIEKEYEIQEIKSPDTYTLNSDKIRFITRVDENGNISVEKTQGDTKGDFTATKIEGQEYKVSVEVEDEVKSILKINKVEKDTNNPIVNVFYKITGGNLPTEGKIIRTDIYGNTSLEGLDINSEYTVQEIKATGYYLASEIKFKIVKDGNEFKIEKIEGDIKENSLVEENNVPTLNLKLENQKMPTYNLEITKIKEITEIGSKTDQEVEALQGAKFQLYKGDKAIGTYTTNEKGQFTINNLYQYVEGKEEGEYTLKETVAPKGYAVIKDIVFKVKEEDGRLKFEPNDGTDRNYTSDGNTLKLQIEDSKIFKLVKRDGETKQPIANTKFAIYNIDEEETFAKDSKGEYVGTKETIDGKEYYTVTTNSSGEVEIDLPEGQYRAVELQAPDEYQINDEVYTFSIGVSDSLAGTEVEWAKEIGGSDEYNKTIKTSDGCYLVVKNNKVVKYNDDGEIQWETEVENDGTGDAKIVIEIDDGNYIFACQEGKKITKISNIGEIIWSKEAKEGLKIGNIVKAKDGGFLLGGYTSGTAVTSGHSEIIKYNQDGEEERVLKEILAKDIETSTEGSSVKIGELIQTQDNGILMTGKISGIYGFVVKYNQNLEIEWKSWFGNSNINIIITALETSDGSILIGGYFESSDIDLGNGVSLKRNNWQRNAMLIKYNNKGEAQWAKSTNDTFDEFRQVIETSDGKYMAVGQVWKYYGDRIGLIIEYDTEGNVENKKEIMKGINTVVETDNGYYLSIGQPRGEIVLKDGTGYNYDSWINIMIKFKLTNVENSITKDVQKVEGNTFTRKLLNTQDGGYVSAGEFTGDLTLENGQTINSNGKKDVIVTKYDATGNIQWARPIGTSWDATLGAVIGTTDGGIVARVIGGPGKVDLGNGEKFTLNQNDYQILVKYDSNGNVQWAKSVGSYLSSVDDWSNSVKETDNGEIIVTGYFYGLFDLGEGDTLNSKNGAGLIIKYNSNGKVLLAKAIEGTESSGNKCLYAIERTKDKGFIVGGRIDRATKLENGDIAQGGVLIKYDEMGNIQWSSSSVNSSDSCQKIDQIIQMDDGGYIVRGYTTYDGYYPNTVMRYDANGKVQWGKRYAASGDNSIAKIVKSQDGGFIVSGQYQSDFSNGDLTYYTSKKYKLGFLIKYNSEGNTIWSKLFRSNGDSYDRINVSQVIETKDKGIIIVGGINTYFDVEFGNGVSVKASIISSDKQGCDGFVVKYKADGTAKWAKSIASSDSKNQNSGIQAVIERNYGDYIIGGYTDSSIYGRPSIGDLGTSKNIISQIKENPLSQQELEVLNNRKEFNITTKIEEFEGVKGGTISGEGETPYEIVKYGDNNTKEIKITPNENYEILKITINGQEQDFQKLEDGSYTMPTLTNVTENKEIIATIGSKDNKFILNKVDKISKEPLQGAKFKIEQVDERTNPEGVIKEIVHDSTQITDPSVLVSGMVRANQHYFIEQDGKYIATNTKKYQIENSLTDTTANTTANSLMVINLSGKKGTYEIAVNAEINSEQDKDIGYAIVSDSGSIPTYDKTDGRFMYISGNVPASDYTYKLEGGKAYYLHFGYRKDDSGDAENESMIINSIKLYKPNYNFEEQDGKYKINTEDKDKESYIPIDLTNNTGKYNLTINAESALDSGNCGYAIVTNSQTIPDYTTEEKVVNLFGKNDAKDYTTVLQGGQMYYLHLGYIQTNLLKDQTNNFTINNVQISLNKSDFYNTEVTTNAEGKGVTQLPFGKYKITEIEAPEGYILNEEPIEIEFLAEGVKEFTIENEKQAEVLVHHYKKGTTEKVADDEKLEGKEGESYVTEPQLFLDNYELDKDQNGKFILPANLKGVYTANNIEVNYEYVGKDVELNVHHYIEGTNIKVPLADGNNAEDEVLKGKEGESYTTKPISDELLSSEYELSKTPENSTGVYQEAGNEVIYYYKKVERQITINKYKEDGVSPLEGAKFTIEKVSTEKTGTIYSTDQNGKIIAKLGTGEYEITEVEAPEGYVLPENSTTKITVNRNTKDEILDITNETQKGNVIVHYYIEGTQNQVPLQDGTVAEDIVKTRTVGEIYATKEPENVSQKYELVEIPNNSSGKITKEDIIVIYYYRPKDSQITNDKLIKESTIEKIKTVEDKVPYTLTYTADLQKYKGNVVVTIVDQLQYEIDETKSNIAGGTYNEANKTITWIENINDVDTYKNGIKQVNINKEIEVVYKNMDTSKNIVSNNATAEISLESAGVKASKSATKDISTDLYKDVEITLVWVDTLEQKDKRPESIILQLKNGDNIVQSKRIDVSKTEDQSKIKFEKVLKYNESGNEIVYTADETVLEGEQHKEDLKFYSKTIQGTIVTNTFKVPEDNITIKVIKEWEDKDNSYNIRPNSLILQVKNKTTEEVVANGQIDVQNENSYTFSGINKYDKNGNEIEYTADELEVNEGELLDYTKKVGELIDKDTDEKEITITNIVNEIAGKVIVKYVDKDTEEEISESIEKTGVVGTTFDVSEDKKDIEGYILTEEPTSKTGKYTKADQEKIYYYVEKSLVIEKHIDINTQEIIYTQTHEGKEGEEYEISSKTFEGYDLISKDEKGNSILPTNEKGKMQKGTIEVSYYYSKKASVIIEYIYKQTGEKISEDTKIIGHENDRYETKAKNIENYILVEEPSNKTGKMKVVKNSDGTYNIETLVQYFYDKEKVYTGNQVDTTVANKIIPNAGFKVGMIISIIASATIAVFFKIRLRKLNK